MRPETGERGAGRRPGHGPGHAGGEGGAPAARAARRNFACRDVSAVVLAGGKGTRLRPFTVTFPKPLVPLGDRPILERLLLQLADAGVPRATLALGHLSSLIRAYVSQRECLAARLAIDFVEEPAPLGTAGALGLIPRPAGTFLVMNGDLLTDLDFGRLLEAHRRLAPAVTISRFTRVEKSDFGVLEIGPDGFVEGYREKPEHAYSVSMGVYVYEPRALDYIRPGERLDFPDLILRLLAAGERVASYEHSGLWLDIGRPADYAAAQELVAAEEG